MTLTVTKTSYRMDLTDSQMLKLMEGEHFSKPEPAGGTLCDKLSRLRGVSAIEYDGHFGAAVYFSIDADDDTPALRAQISALVRVHIKRL